MNRTFPTPKKASLDRKPPVELKLYENVKLAENAPIMRATDNMIATWRRSMRSMGGYWMAEADFVGDPWEMEELFSNGMCYEVRETFGGVTTWQGFLAEMEYTKAGQTYRRSWQDIANKVQVKYSANTGNLISNGSGETGVWTTRGAPTLLEQSTAWRTDGDYSIHITAPASQGEGAYIGASITYYPQYKYTFKMDCKVVSGGWYISIFNRTDSTVLDSVWLRFPGEVGVELEIPSKSTDTSAKLADIVIYSYTSPLTTGEIYCDAASFQAGSYSANTGWVDNTDSQALYGVIEDVINGGNLYKDAATQLANTELAKRSWARVLPPESFGTSLLPSLGSVIGEVQQADRLHLTFYGYAFTLHNRYSTLDENDTTISGTCTSVFNSEIAKAEFVDAGEIETNSTSYLANISSARERQWDILEAIANAGDSSYNRWEFGVLNDRLAYYRMVDEELKGRIRQGKAYDAMGAVLDPWFAEPGYYLIEDMPVGSEHISGRIQDNPRVVFLDEVEFDAADWIGGGTGLKINRVNRDRD